MTTSILIILTIGICITDFLLAALYFKTKKELEELRSEQSATSRTISQLSSIDFSIQSHIIRLAHSIWGSKRFHYIYIADAKTIDKVCKLGIADNPDFKNLRVEANNDSLYLCYDIPLKAIDAKTGRTKYKKASINLDNLKSQWDENLGK